MSVQLGRAEYKAKLVLQVQVAYKVRLVLLVRQDLQVQLVRRAHKAQ